jgi:hypothetical protein
MIEASITGNGPLPTDYGAQALWGMLAGLFWPAIRAIPLELNCGQGFAPVELTALLVPWQLMCKYQLDPSMRREDVQTAAEAATCATFPFAGASPEKEAPPLSGALVQRVLVHRGGPYTLDRLESSSGAELLVTPNHPVWTEELGYVPASELVVGAHLVALDSATGSPRVDVLVAIVRAASTTDVVYNLKTSRSSYVAAGILVHNKCVARGSLVDTPDGAVPIEAVRPGDRVLGQVEGHRAATRVLRTYEKTTILGRLPGRRLAPHVLVTENHRVVGPAGDEEASRLPAPKEDAVGTVYDLATESGNYWAEGVLLRAAGAGR